MHANPQVKAANALNPTQHIQIERRENKSHSRQVWIQPNHLQGKTTQLAGPANELVEPVPIIDEEFTVLNITMKSIWNTWLGGVSHSYVKTWSSRRRSERTWVLVEKTRDIESHGQSAYLDTTYYIDAKPVDRGVFGILSVVNVFIMFLDETLGNSDYLVSGK
ncbi:hypothetical protein FHL15_005530 [Xylaria flabelliformis]|uniref:Uncharacterized protein n=1 Tax=Xylaria flabelliformis TaxID=2512241 RepID=A0A553I035_9PEZI|nr:hypothetical protein FHL15_005530 [Xylaria flabelliformis]